MPQEMKSIYDVIAQIQNLPEAVDVLQAEVTRLHKKYSYECQCEDASIGNELHPNARKPCTACNGTGRRWILGVEGVKYMEIQGESLYPEYYAKGFRECRNRILEGDNS